MVSPYISTLLLILPIACLVNSSKTNYDCCSVCVCSNYNRKMEIDCADKNLSNIPNCQWGSVRIVYLQNNRIEEIDKKTLSEMQNASTIRLNGNNLKTLPAIDRIMKVRNLFLDDNYFAKVPTAALRKMRKLRKIDLSYNNIERVPRNSFMKQRLEKLELNNNPLKVLEGSFMGAAGKFLQSLDLSSTRITNLPFETIRNFSRLHSLFLKNTAIKELPDFAFRNMKKLTRIVMENANFGRIGKKAFAFLPSLQALLLENMELVHFPDLTGTDALEIITLINCGIREDPEDLCEKKKNLEVIHLEHNRLKKMPNLRGCSSLEIIRLDYNAITEIGDSVQGLQHLVDLVLTGNKIRSIGKDDFKGLERLQKLFLGKNGIESIDEDAFSSFRSLTEILLHDNNFSELPTKGLQKLRKITVNGTKTLLNFPAPEYLGDIEVIHAEYPYHCCNYMDRKREKQKYDPNRITAISLKWLTSENMTPFDVNGTDVVVSTDQAPFICTPEPDPFYPCQDLMGDWVLRCGVWFVFLLAVVGNATVIIVIVVSYSKMDVSRFLISNLAFADLFMGIYLGFLAIVDVTTYGNFKRYALAWQTSSGCRTAGFLAVLSSELSVFTLTVITLERYIAIKNAIRVNRKLDLKTAMIVMAIGWVFAAVTASLPLSRVSSYGKFSVCLPFKANTTSSIVFLTFILCLNGLAFLVILCCYIMMYCSIRGSSAWNTSDFRVAKRMALLVITDFLCWAPIVFLSLTAAFGSSLISLEHAKIITVFVFPLNSCANPFLYAIFTSHFKKDMIAICRRVADKYPFFKITKQKLSFSRRSSYSGAASENANIYLRMRRYSLPLLGRGFQNSVTSHDKNNSSASGNSTNRNGPEVSTAAATSGNLERETTV